MTEENDDKVNQDFRCPEQDSTQAPPKYEYRALLLGQPVRILSSHCSECLLAIQNETPSRAVKFRGHEYVTRGKIRQEH